MNNTFRVLLDGGITDCDNTLDGHTTIECPMDYQRSSQESDESLEDDEDNILEDDDEDDDHEYINLNTDDENDEASIHIHPDLYTDLQTFILHFGEKHVQLRLLEAIDQIDVNLHIPLGFLAKTTAEAWKINIKEPLIVRLHLSLSKYLECTSFPMVEVFQPSKKEKFGVGVQVRNIVQVFLKTNWSNLHKQYQQYQKEQTKKKNIHFTDTLGISGHAQLLPSGSSHELVAELINMGFDLTLSKNALTVAHNNLEEAIEILLGNSGTNITHAVPIQSLSLDRNDYQQSDNKAIEDCKVKCGLPGPNRYQLSHPPVLSMLKHLLPESLTKASKTLSHDYDSGTLLEDLNLMPLLPPGGLNAKNMPSIADGFLVLIFNYVRQRIVSLNEYCVICDELHVYNGAGLLKPAVCSRELCVFAFQTLGVMADAEENIQTESEVVDLLINMTLAACKSCRKHVIFDPFPTIVDPKDPCNLLFSPNQQDFQAVLKVLEAIPPMSTLAMLTPSLKQKLDEINPAIYPMIQWIITSNRSHVVKLPVRIQLGFMQTPHQFLLLSSPPAKQAAFQEAKRLYGSTFAFHGSNIENWHSIIRHGLVNASGTKFQMNGAVYGNGIYLSPTLSTSIYYSTKANSRHDINAFSPNENSSSQYLTGSNITCIALCEVITQNIKKHDAIWVCPEQDHVCTRFFFIYQMGLTFDTSVDTQNEKYFDMIKKTCEYRGV